jgi:hypothetical protein
MSGLRTKTKARVGIMTVKQGAKHPKLVLRGAKGAKPVVRSAVNMRARQARHQAVVVLDAGRSIGQTVFELGREAAQSAARARVPRKRTAPRVAFGIAVGATVMYFLDPASGDRRRHNVLGLISANGRSGHQHNEFDTGDQAGGPAHPAPGHMPPEHR